MYLIKRGTKLLKVDVFSETKDELVLDPKYLYTPTEPWDFTTRSHQESVDVAEKMVKLMVSKNGLGIAANQCGLPYSIFALKSSPEFIVAFNPKIVWTSEEKIELEEGCLSYPGLFFEIERPQHIRLRFQTPNGQTRTEKYTGMTARIIQHEMLHLAGLPFFYGQSKMKIIMALKKSKKRGFNYDGKGLLKNY